MPHIAKLVQEVHPEEVEIMRVSQQDDEEQDDSEGKDEDEGSLPVQECDSQVDTAEEEEEVPSSLRLGEQPSAGSNKELWDKVLLSP